MQLAQACQIFVPKTAHKMIVDHAGGLHERVANRRADKPESALLQIFAQGIGLRRLGGHLFVRLPRILPGASVHKSPDVGIKRSELFLYFEESAGVADGGVDFQAVADNSSVAKQFANLLLVVTRHFLWIEAVEHFPVSRTLLQDGVPTQTRLRAL